MSAITVTFEVSSPEQEALLRQYHGLLLELEQLALSAPAGQVLDLCEAAVVQGGQDVSRATLQQVVQQRIDALEKKGAPLRTCACGRPRENRSKAQRQVVSCVGAIHLQRRWWGSRCGCESLGYGADEVLGLDGAYTRALQKQFCRLCADVSFAKTREHLEALRGVRLSKEAVRRACHRRGQRMAQWQTTDESTPQAFAQAAGQAEFGSVEGWAKTLGLRLKARGARWRERNVPRMSALVCVRNGSQWPVYWASAA